MKEKSDKTKKYRSRQENFTIICVIVTQFLIFLTFSRFRNGILVFSFPPCTCTVFSFRLLSFPLPSFCLVYSIQWYLPLIISYLSIPIFMYFYFNAKTIFVYFHFHLGFFGRFSLLSFCFVSWLTDFMSIFVWERIYLKNTFAWFHFWFLGVFAFLAFIWNR